MKTLAILPITILSLGAHPAAEPQTFDLPGYAHPAKKWERIEDVPAIDQAERDRSCAETIEKVRAQGGQPLMQRGPASADEPLLIAAVDKRIDDCPVLVMHADKSDIRPVPDRAEETGFIPAK